LPGLTARHAVDRSVPGLDRRVQRVSPCSRRRAGWFSIRVSSLNSKLILAPIYLGAVRKANSVRSSIVVFFFGVSYVSTAMPAAWIAWFRIPVAAGNYQEFPLRIHYFARSGQGSTPDSFWPESHAMSLSSTWNTPRRSSGGKAFSIAASFSLGSARR